MAWIRPFSVSPEGILTYASHTLNPGGRTYGAARAITHEEAAGALEADGDRITHKGRAFARAGSPALAHRLADLERELAPLDGPGREAAILREVDSHVDVRAARARAAEWTACSRRVRLPSNLFFALLFGVIPLTYSLLGTGRPWPYWVAAAIALHAWAAIAFIRAHARLFPEREGDAWIEAIPILLYPPAAIRADDLLAREVLAGFHPLAAAAALGLPPAELERLARLTLLDLENPIEPVCPVEGELPARIEAWHRAKLLAAVRSLLAAIGIDAGSLTRAPRAESPASRSYCPRCRSQYVIDSGSCAGCGGIALVPLPYAESRSNPWQMRT